MAKLSFSWTGLDYHNPEHLGLQPQRGSPAQRGKKGPNIEHSLNVDPTKKPVQQKRRVFAPERNKAVMEEVEKFLAAEFIREVYYLEWLTNVVMVKKSNGKLKMCMDFTDLNNACPKDSFPLPRIDQLVDSTTGHELLTFIDALSGYNQILMKKEDQEKTVFVTSQGLYCYKVMPFITRTS